MHFGKRVGPLWGRVTGLLSRSAPSAVVRQQAVELGIFGDEGGPHAPDFPLLAPPIPLCGMRIVGHSGARRLHHLPRCFLKRDASTQQAGRDG